MSIYDYIGSQNISAQVFYLTKGDEFYSLVMAAFRLADTDNLEKLQEAFPELYNEFMQRYNAPGGALDKEEMEYVLGEYENG